MSLVVVSQAGCPPCATIKHALKAKGIPFTVVDISQRPHYTHVPVVEYNGRAYKGADALKLVSQLRMQ